MITWKKTIFPFTSFASSLARASSESTSITSASIPAAGVPTLRRARRARVCARRARGSLRLVPALPVGTLTGSAWTLASPAVSMARCAQSTAAFPPGEPESRGLAVSTSDLTVSRATEVRSVVSRSVLPGLGASGAGATAALALAEGAAGARTAAADGGGGRGAAVLVVQAARPRQSRASGVRRRMAGASVHEPERLSGARCVSASFFARGEQASSSLRVALSPRRLVLEMEGW